MSSEESMLIFRLQRWRLVWFDGDGDPYLVREAISTPYIGPIIKVPSVQNYGCSLDRIVRTRW